MITGKKLMIATTACALALAGTMLAGCSNDGKDGKAELVQEDVTVHYEPQDLYTGMTGSDAIANGQDYDTLVEYIVNGGGTKASDLDEAYWRGADGITAYTVMDKTGKIVDTDTAKKAYADGEAIIGIGAMLPPDADADSLIIAISGTDAFDNRTDVASSKGNMSFAAFTDGNGNVVYVVAERSNGNDSPAYNVKFYANGSQKVLLEKLGLSEGASVEEVAAAWKDSVSDADVSESTVTVSESE